MKTYKDHAIVLRSHKLGEADKIITLLTGEHGKKRAVAKGLRRTKSKFGGRLEACTHLQLELYRGRNLDIITGAEIVDPHVPLRENHHKYICAQAMLEMMDKSLHDDQQVSNAFGALSASLTALEGEVNSYELMLAAFELKLCALVGYRPHLDRCLACGSPVAGTSAVLRLSEGGICCPACSGPASAAVHLDPAMLELTRRIFKASMAEVGRMDVDGGAARKLMRLSFSFSEYHLDRPIKSHRILEGYRFGSSAPAPTTAAKAPQS